MISRPLFTFNIYTATLVRYQNNPSPWRLLKWPHRLPAKSKILSLSPRHPSTPLRQHRQASQAVQSIPDRPVTGTSSLGIVSPTSRYLRDVGGPSHGFGGIATTSRKSRIRHGTDGFASSVSGRKTQRLLLILHQRLPTSRPILAISTAYSAERPNHDRGRREASGRYFLTKRARRQLQTSSSATT